MGNYIKLTSINAINGIFTKLKQKKEISVSINVENKKYYALMTFSYSNGSYPMLEFNKNEYVHEIIKEVEVLFVLNDVLYKFNTKVRAYFGDNCQIEIPKEIFASYRRISTRIQFKDKSSYIVLSNEEKCLLSDVSVGGFSFERESDQYDNGDVINDVLVNINGLDTFKVSVVLVSERKLNDENSIYGVSFLEIDSNIFNSLFDFIFKMKNYEIKSYENVTSEELIYLYEQTSFMHLKVDNNEDEKFKEMVEKLNTLKNYPTIWKSYVNQKNGRLLNICSSLRIYKNTFLGQNIIAAPGTILNHRSKSGIYAGIIQHILHQPEYKYYISYIENDINWYLELFENSKEIYENSDGFKYEKIDCIEINTKSTLDKVDENIIIIRNCSKDSFIDFSNENLSLLEIECNQYKKDEFNIEDVLSDYKLTVVREIMCITKNDTIIGYAVAECYPDMPDLDGFLNICKIYSEKDKDEFNEEVMITLSNELINFYKKNNIEKFRIILNKSKHIKSIFDNKKIEIIKLMMNKNSLEKFYGLLRSNFEYSSKYMQLTWPQKTIWYMEKVYPNTSLANISATIIYLENVNFDILEKALNFIVLVNDAFRIRIKEINGEPVQYISEFSYKKFDLIDFSENSNAYYKWTDKKSSEVFDIMDNDLFKFTMIKLGENKGGGIFNFHHLISDAWSMKLFTDQIAYYYYKLKTKKPLLMEKAPSYIEHIFKEEEYMLSNKFLNSKKFWKETFSTEPEFIGFKLDNINKRTSKSKRITYVLTDKESANLNKFCNENKFSIYHLFLTTLYSYIGITTRKNDICLGAPVLNRTTKFEKNTVGMFISSIPLRMEFKTELSFNEYVMYVASKLRNFYRHQKYPFELILEEFRGDTNSSNRLYDVALSYQSYKLANDVIKYKSRWNFCGHQTESLVIHINDRENEGNFIIQFDYLIDVFSEEEINRMFELIMNLLNNAIESPETKVSHLELMSKEEKNKILYEFNDTYADYPKDKTINKLFEDQVEKTPDNIAIVFNDNKITYRELNNKSNILSNYLVNEQNVKPDTLIGIMMERSELMIVGIMGTIKSGGAYVPISVNYPEERIKTIVEDAKIEIIICDKKQIKVLNKLQWECSTFKTYICMDSEDVYVEDEGINNLMNKDLWNHVGSSSKDDEIKGGGWQNSFTGEYLSKEEMNEYSDNILLKLKPYLHKKIKVLEIGCATGLSMFKIAPFVGFYYGTDLSESTIANVSKKVLREGIKNIKLESLAAHDINKIKDKDFDIVILNSVIQCFSGYNYLRKIINNVIKLMSNSGIIFIGDIMNHDLKSELECSLSQYKKNNPNVKTKTDFSNELFVSKKYFEDISIDLNTISKISFTDKIHTIKNELTEFRYDAIINIDKNNLSSISKLNNSKRYKHQIGFKGINNYSSNNSDVRLNLNNAIYVIYTSGTTGKPKGVMINHGNALNFVEGITKVIEYKEEKTFLSIANIIFDMFVFDLLPSLTKGLKIFLASDDEILNPPHQRDLIEKNKINMILLTPSMLKMLMVLDDTKFLRNCTDIILGGEELPIDLFKTLKDNLSNTRIFNAYGPTEVSVCSTVKNLTNEKTVNIGKPINNTCIYILDKNKNMCPVGINGELCIVGDSVSNGYLNRHELTQEKFIDNPYKLGEKMYKTGDLARWLPDGNIEISGRIDFQVKIRGNRIEIGEIENILSRYNSITDSFVTVNESIEKKYLVAYYLANKKVESDKLRDFLLRFLPDYMIPLYFIQIDKIPLTPNGKLDRKKLPNPIEYLSNRKSLIIQNEFQKTLIGELEKLLGIVNISIKDNFFEIGGDSIKAINFITQIQKIYNIDIKVKHIFELGTIEKISEYIKEAKESEYKKIIPQDRREYYPVTSTQKRLCILNKIDENGLVYNMPGIIKINGYINIEKIKKAFCTIVKNYEIFRTGIEFIENEFVQKVYNNIELEIDEYNIENIDDLEKIKLIFFKSFDLKKPPLLRVAIAKKSKDINYLLVDMHQLVSDGLSMELFLKDFYSLYNGKESELPKLQFRDYAVWQKDFLESEYIKRQKEFWLNIYNDEIPILNLPTDFTRSHIQNFEGDKIIFEIKDEYSEIKEIMNNTGTTIHMILLSVLNIVLSKYTGQEDIIIGMPVSGRTH
ncbi:MAG: condensation domain-containing protein, partial [Clostridiales bacterium]